MDAHIDPVQLHHKGAVSGTASIVSALIAHSDTVNPLIQEVAGIVAILSGVAAIVYYIVSIREKLRGK